MVELSHPPIAGIYLSVQEALNLAGVIPKKK
jgi:hypothetical protein